MKLLIDTHTFIWFNAGKSEISSQSLELIENRNNNVFISIASIWELSIKLSLGKIFIDGGLDSIYNDIKNNDFQILPIERKHLTKSITLPFYHRDPFDRIIIAQSITEKMPIISRDSIFDKYQEENCYKRIW